MMGKFIIFITIIIFIIFILKISTFAQTTSCGGGQEPRAEGLVTTPSLSGKFKTTGACVVDSKAALVPSRIPTYDDLKATYFDHSQFARGNLPNNLVFTQDGVYSVSGSETVMSSPPSSAVGTQVIFFNGKVLIPSNIIYQTASGNGGLVIIAKGDIVIEPSVTQIDAILISGGIIFTAGNGCLTSQVSEKTPGQPIEPLVVNGSLISLNPDNKIRFCRNLVEHPTIANFDSAAEIVNAQIKYLILLRHIMSNIEQKWSEIP